MNYIVRLICFLILIVTCACCVMIKTMQYNRNEGKIKQGDSRVTTPHLDDDEFDDLENASYFSNTRVFISNVVFGDRYVYYIFWGNGRCFFSTVRYISGITLDNVLYDKSGTGGYYTISHDSLIIERYSTGAFLYDYYSLTENKLLNIGFKRRKAFTKRKGDLDRLYDLWFEERYTKPGADSIYFNSDSVALWQPFW